MRSATAETIKMNDEFVWRAVISKYTNLYQVCDKHREHTERKSKNVKQRQTDKSLRWVQIVILVDENISRKRCEGDLLPNPTNDP